MTAMTAGESMNERLSQAAHHVEDNGLRNALSHALQQLSDEERGRLVVLGLGTDELLALAAEHIDVPTVADVLAERAANVSDADVESAVIHLEQQTHPFEAQILALLHRQLKGAA